MKISHENGIMTLTGNCPEGREHRLVFDEKPQQIISISVDGAFQGISDMHPSAYIIHHGLGRDDGGYYTQAG